MKPHSLLLALTLLLSACDNSERDRQAELQAIELEMQELTRAERHYQSEKNSALIRAAAGGAVAGAGAAAGDVSTFGVGVVGAADSVDRYERAYEAQKDVRSRHESLEERRHELLVD